MPVSLFVFLLFPLLAFFPANTAASLKSNTVNTNFIVTSFLVITGAIKNPVILIDRVLLFHETQATPAFGDNPVVEYYFSAGHKCPYYSFDPAHTTDIPASCIRLPAD